MIIATLILATLFLAYSNGANDNFKGVATLFGTKTTNYKKAIIWATLTTFAGSVTAIIVANKLIENFSGKGLVPDALLQLPAFAISVSLSAGLTVFIASKVGMPISTTHGLVGGLFGVGVVAIGTNFVFLKLVTTFLIPLLVSPLVAGILSFCTYMLFKFLTKKGGISKSNCLCLNETQTTINTSNNTDVLTSNSTLNISICNQERFIEKYDGVVFGITLQKIIDELHFLSAGIVSFARGLNDTPKIVGLLLVVNTLDVKLGMFIVGLAMAIGGLLNAKKVGITMSKKITPMSSGQGFSANLITGILVSTASFNGLPVSTTHVSVGSIFGIGTVTKKYDLSMVLKIISAWVLTLPIAAIFGAIIYKLVIYFSPI